MIFLSYCWADDNLANKIDDYFNDIGITLTRDRRDLKYKQSIKEFMESIREADYVIMIISTNYLQSKNCMYEVSEFVKNKDFKDKILPVICSESEVFDVLKRIEYQKFWTSKVEELNNALVGLDPTKAIPVIQHQREYKLIESDILEFLSTICDMNNIVVKNNNFTDQHLNNIIDYADLNDIIPKKLVVNIGLIEKSSIQISEIIDSVSSEYNEFKIEFQKDDYLSFTIKTHKKVENVELDLQKRFGLSNFKKLKCFYYTNAYYIAGKRKTEEYNWKTIIWWNHFDNGYVEDIRKAGIYSIDDVERIIKLGSLTKKDQLAFECNYVDEMNIPIFPVNSDHTINLVRDKSKIIGNTNWEDNEGFE